MYISTYFPDHLRRRKALAESVSRRQKWRMMRDKAGLDMYFSMNDRQARAAVNSLSFKIEKVENRTIPERSAINFPKPVLRAAHS